MVEGLGAEELREAEGALVGVGERGLFSGDDGVKREGVLVGLDGEGRAVVEMDGARRSVGAGAW
jgi:hypothetical protein